MSNTTPGCLNGPANLLPPQASGFHCPGTMNSPRLCYHTRAGGRVGSVCLPLKCAGFGAQEGMSSVGAASGAPVSAALKTSWEMLKLLEVEK